MKPQITLKQMRLFEGLTLAEASRLSGISAKTISEAERMKRKPRTRTLLTLVRTYDFLIDTLDDRHFK